MTRIAPAPPRGILRLVYWFVKRQFGRVLMPVQVLARHRTLLWAVAKMERAHEKSQLVSAAVKELAQVRAAQMIGCPF